MPAIRPLLRFGAALFVGLCIFYLLRDSSLLGENRTIQRILGAINLDVPVSFAGDLSGPVMLSIVAAGLALAFGMRKFAKSTTQLVRLSIGLLVICFVMPVLALLAVLIGAHFLFGVEP